jgi:alcohol dehydrogenase (NADP+)
MVDPCRVCSDCCTGLEPYCTGGRTLTYKAIGRDGQPTYGGYSQKIVVDEDFAVRMPATLPLQTAAPLLCAGITIVFAVAALTRRARHTHVAIIGFGGLGDVGVQIARAMDTQVAVLDLDDDKHGDALRLGPMRSTSAPIPARSSASPIVSTSSFPRYLGMSFSTPISACRRATVFW